VKLHLLLDRGQFVGIDDFIEVGDLFFCHLAGDTCQQGLFAPDQYPAVPLTAAEEKCSPGYKAREIELPSP
jgi:hypothetical protein